MVTSNLRVAKKLRKELGRRRMKFVHVTSVDTIPAYITVVISTRSECKSISSSQVLIKEDFRSITSLVDRAYELSVGKNRCKVATVSIDPGKRVGVAFLCDDLLTRTEVFYAKQDVVKEAELFLKSHQCRNSRVIVGAGAPEHRDELLRHIRNISVPNLKIYLVDENSSRENVYISPNLSKDESSAVSISSRRGHQV